MIRRPKSVDVCLALFIAGASCCSGTAAIAGDTPSVSPAPAGMEAHIDPTTGRFVVPAPVPGGGDAARAALQAEADAPESQSPVLGGGYVLDLRGRAKVGITANVTADGDAVAHCGEPATDSVVQR